MTSAERQRFMQSKQADWKTLCAKLLDLHRAMLPAARHDKDDWKTVRTELLGLLRAVLPAARHYIWRYTIWFSVITSFFGWLSWYGFQRSGLESSNLFSGMVGAEILGLFIVVLFYTGMFKAEQDKQLRKKDLPGN